MALGIGFILICSLGAVTIKNADLEVDSNGTTAGSDSYKFKLMGRNGTPADVAMTLQNIADATGDEYRLAILDNASNERMTIDDDGNVGIGETNPTSKLQANGVVSTGNGAMRWKTLNGNLDADGITTVAHSLDWTKIITVLGNGLDDDTYRYPMGWDDAAHVIKWDSTNITILSSDNAFDNNAYRLVIFYVN